MTFQRLRLRLAINLSTTKTFTTGSTPTRHPNKCICTQSAETHSTNWASTISTFHTRARKRTPSRGWISGTTQSSIGHPGCPDLLCTPDRACSTILIARRKSASIPTESSKCLTIAQETFSTWPCSHRCQRANSTHSVEFASPKSKWTTCELLLKSTLLLTKWTLQSW